MMYDYLVVGSGLYGAIFAHEAKAHGKSVLVVDKRPNIAGNIYTENIEGNVILLILGLYELQKICDNRTHKSWRAIGVALLPVFAVFLIYAVSYLMSYKLETMSTSYNIRSDDWSACLRVFFSSPIWGVGINNYKPIYNSFSSAVYRTGIGLSTGLFILLAQTGVSIIIWPILGLIRNKYERWGYSLLIVFLVLFSVTNVPYKLLNVLYVGSILITSKREIEAKGVV